MKGIYLKATNNHQAVRKVWRKQRTISKDRQYNDKKKKDK